MSKLEVKTRILLKQCCFFLIAIAGLPGCFSGEASDAAGKHGTPLLQSIPSANNSFEIDGIHLGKDPCATPLSQYSEEYEPIEPRYSLVGEKHEDAPDVIMDAYGASFDKTHDSIYWKLQSYPGLTDALRQDNFKLVPPDLCPTDEHEIGEKHLNYPLRCPAPQYEMHGTQSGKATCRDGIVVGYSKLIEASFESGLQALKGKYGEPVKVWSVTWSRDLTAGAMLIGQKPPSGPSWYRQHWAVFQQPGADIFLASEESWCDDKNCNSERPTNTYAARLKNTSTSDTPAIRVTYIADGEGQRIKASLDALPAALEGLYKKVAEKKKTETATNLKGI